jgi:hypothetical protein
MAPANLTANRRAQRRDSTPRRRPPVQLFEAMFQQPIPFGVAFLVAGTMIFIVAKSAMAAESRPSGWVRTITSPNAKIFFTLLFVVWAVVFGVGLQLVPHEGANSPYGGLALIAMFTGFFIMMGLLWAVIGE